MAFEPHSDPRVGSPVPAEQTPPPQPEPQMPVVAPPVVETPDATEAPPAVAVEAGTVTSSPTSAPIAATTATVPIARASEAAIQDVVGRYYEAWSLGDWDRFSEQFWRDAHLASVRPREAGGSDEVVSLSIAAYVAEARRTVNRTQPLQLAREVRRVEIFQDVAQLVVEFRATDQSGDAPQHWRGVDCFTLVRHSGEWRVAALVYAPTSTTP